jgi:hypothetical protein
MIDFTALDAAVADMKLAAAGDELMLAEQSETIAIQDDEIEALDEVLEARDATIATQIAAIAALRAEFDAYKASHPDVTHPPPPPPPVDPVPPTGFVKPDASNTGARGALVASAWPTIKAGTVIKDKILAGGKDISANNVSLINCKITGGWPNAKGRTGFLMQNCTVIGNGALKGFEVGDGKVLNCDISGVQNGGIVEGSNYLIKGNYIHDLSGGGSDPHYDGMEIYGPSSNGVIEGNTIAARDTSCIFVANLWGAHDNIKINNNWLSGADMPCRTEGWKSNRPITGVRWTNNVVEKGRWGYWDLERTSPSTAFKASAWDVTKSGNVDALTGAAI